MDDPLPEDLLSVATLFSLSTPALRKAIKRDEAPDGELTPSLARLLAHVLDTRLADYATTIEEDDDLLASLDASRRRLRMAIIVRRGEKAILRKAREELAPHLSAVQSTSSAASARPLSRKEAREAKKRAAADMDVDDEPDSKRSRA